MIAGASEVLPNSDSEKIEDIAESEEIWSDIHVFQITERTPKLFAIRVNITHHETLELTTF